MRTTEGRTHPFGQFVGPERAAGLLEAVLAMHRHAPTWARSGSTAGASLAASGTQPSPGGNLLDVEIVLPDSPAPLLTHGPDGVVPNQDQNSLVQRRQFL